MILSQALSAQKNNNLGLLRLFAAAAVVISHAWPLALGPGAHEPLQDLTGRSLGGWAVFVFFFLSGFLIVQSAERRSVSAFWAARLRRILPGLLTGLVMALVLAITSGAAPDGVEAIRYVLRGLSLFGLEHKVSNAYINNPYPEAVNGPLWSLQYEVAAYLVCFTIVKFGLLNNKVGLVMLSLAFVALVSIAPSLSGRLAVFAPLMFSFGLGMLTWRMRSILPLGSLWMLALVPVAMVLGKGSVLGDLVAGLVFAYGLLLLAFKTPVIDLSADPSYGIYIYGWPVAQTTVFFMPGISPLALAATSLMAVLPIAWASWTFIEKPTLLTRIRVA